ncbi:FAD-dependent oxidoreductase [Acetobacter oeni]|nr:NAD(P)/FAD-dependent oxidoreductase [Acetobacter oeni]MBB3881422.1 2-polyprenyl-6-methoxyphenol hydroxylase-like FAD-dependent oxidoreductase [Acetobacter oeni]NHO18288.1 FAD-dependent monooxygenase [Acetobacter oeni]
MAMDRIAIVGGGPGGLILARLLQLRGLSPVVFERDTHPEERPQGGSLDLHSETGQCAMKQAGLETEFAAASRPEDQGDRLYDIDGTLLFDCNEPTDNRPEIDRTVLRRILLDSLSPDTVRWGCRIAKVTSADKGFVIVGDERDEHFDVIVGADGAWSYVRRLLDDAIPVYEGVTLVELGFDVERHPAIDRLTGSGKMFAAGDNCALITQRNGHNHIRGYAGLRLTEDEAKQWQTLSPEQVRLALQKAFAGWAPMLTDIIETDEIIGVRPLYALPVGYRWKSREGLTLLGDAAHLMSPFSGEGVNLALTDAVDLAEALTSGGGWTAVTRCEEKISARAATAAEGAARGLNGAFSSEGVTPLLEHYRARRLGN